MTFVDLLIWTVELYCLAVCGFFLLVWAIWKMARPASARPSTDRLAFWCCVLAAVLWPGTALVLILHGFGVFDLTSRICTSLLARYRARRPAGGES